MEWTERVNARKKKEVDCYPQIQPKKKSARYREKKVETEREREREFITHSAKEKQRGREIRTERQINKDKEI